MANARRRFQRLKAMPNGGHPAALGSAARADDSFFAGKQEAANTIPRRGLSAESLRRFASALVVQASPERLQHGTHL
jgi:hypothetical protein